MTADVLRVEAWFPIKSRYRKMMVFDGDFLSAGIIPTNWPGRRRVWRGVRAPYR